MARAVDPEPLRAGRARPARREGVRAVSTRGRRLSSRGGVRRLISAPMFPGYLFLHHAMDKASYVEVVKARGLVKVLGEQWDRLHVVPDVQIEALQRVLAA